MRRRTFAFVKGFDQRCTDADIHVLTDQCMRDTVVIQLWANERSKSLAKQITLRYRLDDTWENTLAFPILSKSQLAFHPSMQTTHIAITPSRSHVSTQKRIAVLVALMAALAVIPPAYARDWQNPWNQPHEPWLLPFDIGQKHRTDPVVLQPTQEQIYEFHWDSFIALNWPYLVGTSTGQPGQRGQPDTSARGLPIFGKSRRESSPTVVWETYMDANTAFVDNPDPNNRAYPVFTLIC
jgi:hypothetical protein